MRAWESLTIEERADRGFPRLARRLLSGEESS